MVQKVSKSPKQPRFIVEYYITGINKWLASKGGKFFTKKGAKAHAKVLRKIGYTGKDLRTRRVVKGLTYQPN